MQRPALDEAGRSTPTRQRERASTGEAVVITCAPKQVQRSPLPPRPLRVTGAMTGATRRRVLAVGVIGPGRVGSALLEQLRAAQPRLARDSGLELKLCGVVASKRMWLDCDDAELNARHGGAQTWRPNDLDAFAEHVRGNDGRHALLIDCSANDAVAAHYPRWLGSGLHVVTPNKLAGSGPLERWQAIRSACAGGARFRCEATVYAGLAVQPPRRPAAVLRAGARGTCAGLYRTRSARRSFRPGCGAQAGDPGARGRLDELDAPMAAALAQAHAAGGVLRHVAHLDRHGRASVRLQVLPASHAFAHTRLTDNILQVSTRLYCDIPLIV